MFDAKASRLVDDGQYLSSEFDRRFRPLCIPVGFFDSVRDIEVTHTQSIRRCPRKYELDGRVKVTQYTYLETRMTENGWDEFAIEWDVNADVRIYSEKAYAAWAEKVAPEVQKLAQSRVLDFGCGTGLLAQKLAKRCGQVVAVDSSPRMIEVLDKKIEESGTNNIVTLVATVDNAAIRDHPHLSNRFDMIVASSVCSFLPNYEATLFSLSALLNPGGWFVQWDWILDMPQERISRAFEVTGLAVQYIGPEFILESEEGAAGVVMGVGRMPC